MLSNPLLDKKETRIQRMFGEIAPWYDFLNHLLSLNIDKRWRRKTTQLVPLREGGPLLDLCTGTGDLAFAYQDVSPKSSTILGADFCHPMLVLARKKSTERTNETPIPFLEADAQQLPFAENTFEVVTVAFGLRNITSLDRGLAEMVRVTRMGGRVAILEFSRPRNWFLRSLYLLYFRFLLPLVGQIFSRSKDSAYKYLPESVMQFPDYEALAERMKQHGLTQVEFHPLTFGIATLYIGTKGSISKP